MPLFAIVVVSDVALVLFRGTYMLVSVDVYSAGMYTIYCTTIWTLLFVVRPGALWRPRLVFALLFALVLAVVDMDRYSDVLVKCIGSVLLV